MPDSNDFFGSGARSDWTRQPVSAPRYQLAGTGTGTRMPAGRGARPPVEREPRPRDDAYAPAEPRRTPERREPQTPAGGLGAPSTLDWMELTGAGSPHLPASRPQESTPIFDALVSAWFRKGSSLFSKDRSSEAAGGTEPEETQTDSSWSSAADRGWEAAEAVAQSTPDSYTTSGLPRRTPNARLLPGSMAPDGLGSRHLERKPEEMRSRLTDFQRGSNEGRHNVSTKRWTPDWDEKEQRAE